MTTPPPPPPPPGSPPPPPPPPGGAPQGWGPPTPPPHPSGTTSEERTWALAAHIGSLAAASIVGLAFLAPLVVLLVKGKDSAFVRAHAVESLNFQLSTLIYVFVSVVLAFVLVGFVLLAVLAVLWLVTVILATIKASNGEPYRYPLTIRMVS